MAQYNVSPSPLRCSSGGGKLERLRLARSNRRYIQGAVLGGAPLQTSLANDCIISFVGRYPSGAHLLLCSLPGFCVQVDILSKLPKTEFNQKLAATKWSEILEGLNIAVDMIGDIPKLTSGDYGDLVQKVKRLGDHSHVQVGEGYSLPPRLTIQALTCARSLSRRDNSCRNHSGNADHPLPDLCTFFSFLRSPLRLTDFFRFWRKDLVKDSIRISGVFWVPCW